MNSSVFDTVKTALRRRTTTAFDEEITMLIHAACEDLKLAGVVGTDTFLNDGEDNLLAMAICTYCKMNFGETDEYEHLKSAYDEQKAQLQMSGKYAKWRNPDV